MSTSILFYKRICAIHATIFKAAFATNLAMLSIMTSLAASGPYTPDGNTVLLDHFDGSTAGPVLGYQAAAGCGGAFPAGPPNATYIPSATGYGSSLNMCNPGNSSAAATYVRYNGELLSQPNGTLEFIVYLNSYSQGLSLVDQGQYYGACAGWTFGLGLDTNGVVSAGAWSAFNMTSGTNRVPLNRWTHVALTWGSTGAKIYIDGQLAGSDANTGRAAPGFGGSLLVRMGTHAAGVCTVLDELRVSNVQRTSFNVPNPPPPPPPPPTDGPYIADGNTVLLDHFDGSAGGTLAGYQNGSSCGGPFPAGPANASFVAGARGFSSALRLCHPGTPQQSASYVQYGGGQLLSQPNGTLELLVYLASYGEGLGLVDQGPYYGACAGWTFGLGVNADGTVSAGAWAAFNLNSGSNRVPLNEWAHLAVSWGSAGARLYINGQVVGSDANTGRPAPGFGGSVLMRLGTHTPGVCTMLDELRISNIQRTSFNLPPRAVVMSNPQMFAGFMLSGPTGVTVRIDYAPALGNTNNWLTLTNLMLPTSPYRFIDYESANAPRRFYRAVLP